jgi:hypothetical protein
MSQLRPGDPFDPDEFVEPDGSASTEQVEYSEATHSVLTPEGQIESYGSFARGLGPRWIKIAIATTGIVIIGALVVGEL